MTGCWALYSRSSWDPRLDDEELSSIPPPRTAISKKASPFIQGAPIAESTPDLSLSPDLSLTRSLPIDLWLLISKLQHMDISGAMGLCYSLLPRLFSDPSGSISNAATN